MPVIEADRAAPSPWPGYAAAVGAASLFAWLGPLSRWAYDGGMVPVSFVAWRAGIGALALAVVVIAMWSRLPDLRLVPRRQWLVLGVAAVTALTLNLSSFAAFERTSVALVLIGFYTYPAMVAVIAVLLGRDAPSRLVLGALGLASVGMLLVVAGSLDGTTGVRLDLSGLLLAFGAAASQTVFVTISRDGYRAVPAQVATMAVLSGTLLGCLVVGLAAGLGPALLLPAREPGLLPTVAVAGILVAALPSLLFLTAIRRIGGTRAGIVMLLEPVVGVGLAALLLGETLRPVQVLGAAAVLGAALLLQRSRPAAVRAIAAEPERDTALGAHEAVPGPPGTR